MLAAVVVLSVAFGLANGLHDASNAIAAPVVTKAMSARTAVAVSVVGNLVGPFLVGTAVATTVAGIVSVPRSDLLAVLAAAGFGALAWSLATFAAGLPSSSGHCLVGALSGAALAEGGPGAVHWGGMSGLRPVGAVGALVWLVVASLWSLGFAYVAMVLARRGMRRARATVVDPIRRLEVVTSAALALAHGSNDGQKTMGLLALALVADRPRAVLTVPVWVVVVAAVALASGTSLGGWRVARTLGRGIYPLRALAGLVSQASGALVLLTASLAGAPVSTTNVVAPAVVGAGASERLHHVHWGVVRHIAVAWLVTLPASGILAAATLPAWRALR